MTLIDLDKGSIALAMVDISHFITWTIHNSRSWSEDKMNLILTAYQQVRRLSTEERELILTDQISPCMTLALAQWHFEKKVYTNSLERLKRCLKVHREKMAYL